jgi:hypothetical protein
MLEGLSRFLVQHERCGAGFDVAHPAGLGSGRVSITCRGCGARHEYATATIEVERELIIEPATPTDPAREPEPRTGEPAAIPPRPAPYPESRRAAPLPPAGDRSAPTGPGRTGRRREVDLTHAEEPPAEVAAAGRGAAPPAHQRAEAPARGGFLESPRTTIALLVVTVAAVGFALLRLVDDDGGKSQNPPAQQSPPASAPATPAPTGSGGLPAPSEQPTTTLRTERFSVQTPLDWTRQTAGGGLLLEPPSGGRVNVQIFFERSPELSASQMAHNTADFLRREVPGASLYPRQIEISAGRAYELTARGPGETAIAVDVLRGPYRYLIVRRIFAGAKPLASLAAGRIVRSFRPV